MKTRKQIIYRRVDDTNMEAGEFVTEEYAKANPDTCVKEIVTRYSPFIDDLIKLGQNYEENGFAPDEGFGVTVWVVNGPHANS